MAEPVVIQLSRAEVYVNSLSFGGSDAVAAALSTNFIHLVDLEAKKSKQTLDIAKNLVGLHFDLKGSPVLRAVDDSFGIHLFDIRSGSKKKSRLNPIVENHTVNCSATSDQYIALASSTFVVESIDDMKKKKRKKKGSSSSDDDDDDDICAKKRCSYYFTKPLMFHGDRSDYPHVVSIFDIRKGTEPVITLKDSHSDSVNSLSFTKDGRHLITGGSDGLINMFDLSMPKEDDALMSTNQVESSIARVGSMSKRLFYACTDDNKCEVFTPNSPSDVDVLFRKNARPNHFLVDLVKGGTEERPVAMLECNSEGKVYLVTVSADGKNSEVVDEWSGHTDVVRSVAYNGNLFVSGGEDGKIVVKPIDLRPAGGKREKKEKKKRRKKSEPY